MYGIIDCDNCYVSCERVFRPDLKHKPVVVLSNNDGCVVARSNEAKQLGIKAGTPFYQIREHFPEEKVHVFSSNYELYGEMTARVMNLIRQEAPQYFRYSIDECFIHLDQASSLQLKNWGERLHQKVMKHVGIPISIGIAPNKTLAKVASHFAKRYSGYRHCCLIDTEEKRTKALQLFAIEDVWGIGRRYAAKLRALGITTAWSLAIKPQAWVQQNFHNVVMLRTWQELNGEDCVPDEEMAKKKSICTSRSFSGMISDLAELKAHVSNYAVRCAEKLRKEKSVASQVSVFIRTNPFRDDLPQYSNFIDLPLHTATNPTIPIVKTATKALEIIFQPGFHYKKAGVIIMGTTSETAVQADLFDMSADQVEKLKKIDAVMDRINKINGSDTVLLGAQQYALRNKTGKTEKFANMIRHDFRSPNPTTRWCDIIHLK